MKKTITFLIIILGFSTKNPGQNSSNPKLQKILHFYGVKKITDYDLIIINTKLGCPACSESVNDEFLGASSTKRKLLIVTSMSPKTFKIKFSSLLNNSNVPNVILDFEDLCYKKGLVYKVPKFIFLKRGQIISELETLDIKSILSR